MMKEEEKLMKLDLQKENKKIEANQINGIKLYFFRMIYVLLQNQIDNYFRDVVFIIAQFIQLMSFPLDTAFSSGWKNFWYGTVGHFFSYFQLIYLWYGNSQFYIISYIIASIYILIFVVLVIYTLHLLSNYILKSKTVIGILLTIYEFECVLNIPFLKILLAVFSFDSEKLEVAPIIACKGSIHIGMIIISCILIICYLFLIILFHMTLFEFGAIHGKIRAAFTSSTEVLLVIIKFILVIAYQFIKHEMALALITFVFGAFLLFNFLEKQPFINNTITKIYFTLYLLFFWSGFTCIVSLLLKNTRFEGGILLLILGYPFIVLTIISKELEFTLERVFEYVGDKYKDGYKVLMEIEYFLKLEDSLEDKIKTREQKILYFYINNYETNCTDPDCPLKQFLNIPLSVENFSDMKICLLQHAEMLYKTAVSKYPFNAKLRLSYAIFLYKRLNKKQKGTNEILLLNRYTTNLEDSFLIYRAQRFIEEENEGHSDSESNSKTVNSVTYKAILNNIKVLIGKITTNYIDFWTILAISDESKSENFQKMSKIGTRISKLNEDLISDFERLERVNLYDQDTIKLYSQYLSEILNNHSSANEYNNKLVELEQRKHQFNEENLFDLNYKAMARSEDYKFIVISGAPTNFNTICNISLSICPLFGYTKEELIGRPLDYILPELFCTFHKKTLIEKIEEFKKTMLVKNKSMSLKVRSEPKVIETFAKTKMKYLVPIKMKIALVASEEGNIFGVSKVIIDNHSTSSNEEEIVYILTDNELIVQNFTPNAPKLLCLHSSAINNNLDVSDYIREFNEEFMKEINNYGESKETNWKIIKHIKVDVLKKMFTGPEVRKLITWRLGDVINNSDQAALNYKNPKFLKTLKTNMGKAPPMDNRKSYGSIFDNFGKLPFVKGNNFGTRIVSSKKNLSSFGEIFQKDMYYSDINNNDENENAKKKRELFKRPSTLIDRERERQVDINDFHSNLISDSMNGSNIANENNYIKNENQNKSKVYHKFVLSVSDVVFSDTKIGHIFRFELYNGNNLIETSANTSSKFYKKSLKKPPTIKEITEIERSDISLMSFTPVIKPPESKPVIFNATVENPNGINLGLDNTYIPNLIKDNEFTIDVSKMSFKQNKEFDPNEVRNPFEQLKQEAIEKVSKMKKIKDEEEEESEESEYTSSSGENESNEKESSVEDSSKDKVDKKSGEDNNSLQASSIPPTDLSIPSKDLRIIEKQLSNQGKKNQTQNAPKHNKEEEFYRVNVTKITYFVYNYNSGFVEMVKDPKYKESQIDRQIRAEKEKLSKLNAKFLSTSKSNKEKKKGATATKKIMDDEELDAYSKKKIKLKEIQKALASKEKQSSIVNLCIFSFIVFILVIGSAITSIMMNTYLRDKTIIYYNLIEKSVTLYRNLIFEINFVREMILLAHPNYENIYDEDKEIYYANFSHACYEYYLETCFVLSNLSTTINTLSEENKNKIIGVVGKLEIIDPLKTSNGDYYTKSYELLIYSAFHELNAALYHVSQMAREEINSYEDNVYYFMRNSMNYMMVISEQQIDNFTDEFYNEIKKAHYILIVCIAVMIIVYAFNFFIFVHFYQKVEERKQSYLSVFYEIGSNFIVTSLAKCEKFSQKIQLQDDMMGMQGEKISIDSSSEDTDIENDIGSIASIGKIKDNKISNAGKARNVKKISHTQTKIGGFIVLFILLAVQIVSYYYYYIRISLYKHYVQYEYYNNKYNSRFLFPFIALREYLYDQKKILLMEEVDIYLDNSLITFYTELANISDYRDKFTSYLPESYSEFVDSLFRDEQCSFINNFLSEHSHAGFNTCEEFFYNTSNYGFQAVLTTYIEEIRIMRDLEKSYLEVAEEYNFTYNESLIGTAGETKHYESFKDDVAKMKIYNQYNPVLILNETTHKTAVIIYRFVVMKVVQSALDNLFDAIHLAFEETIKIGLIINITFIVVVTIGFTALWLPFVLGENETIYKTKNMLSIIPREVLFTLPHINIMLGIDDEGN